MKVSKQMRKYATLLMLSQCEKLAESGERIRPEPTSYEIARWHKLSQSNVWIILEEMQSEGMVEKLKFFAGDTMKCVYTLTEFGQNFLKDNHDVCSSSGFRVVAWHLHKIKQSLETW